MEVRISGSKYFTYAIECRVQMSIGTRNCETTVPNVTLYNAKNNYHAVLQHDSWVVLGDSVYSIYPPSYHAVRFMIRYIQ